MVGVVRVLEQEVTAVKPGDRVTVNVETFCGHCFAGMAMSTIASIHRRLVSWLPYR